MKTWASFSRDSFFPTKSILPSYDRTAIVDPSALEGIFLKEWWKRISCQPTIKAIALTESRDVSGGIEVGVVLPKPQMDYFTTFFIEGLNAIP
ncbi:hypothetical protein M0R45_036943 [Rubus argutus]|uniref:Uncharacterized protein n=1 Tax=Rubus argutus TaxID=59490 RepID=A0AAW1VXI8_RUBAR